MELKSNPEDRCQAGFESSLAACENPVLCPMRAVRDVTISNVIDLFTFTDLACELDHRSTPCSALMPGSAMSLDEAASFQLVGKEKSLRGWPHAEPIRTNSISSLRSVDVNRSLQNGLSPVAPLLLKVFCAWADESGKGSSLSKSRCC
jgi:hypothetical protein